MYKCILCEYTVKQGKPTTTTEGDMCGDGMGCRRRALKKMQKLTAPIPDRQELMDWQKGEPEKDGYYLVAWLSTSGLVIVSELWFNPEAVHHWWFTRGYANQAKLGGINDAMRQEVIGWMPMPDPPIKDWTKESI